MEIPQTNVKLVEFWHCPPRATNPTITPNEAARPGSIAKRVSHGRGQLVFEFRDSHACTFPNQARVCRLEKTDMQ
jgi:hypothetical protein